MRAVELSVAIENNTHRCFEEKNRQWKWIFKFQEKITWNVKAGIPEIPVLSLDGVGILLWYATEQGFPQISTLAFISMISKFLATQPNILKQKISQTGYGPICKEEAVLLGFTACGFCQRDSSSVTRLTAFPNSINWNLTEKEML